MSILSSVALTAVPAEAAYSRIGNPARAYVQARAAAMSGDHRRSAELLGLLAEAESDNQSLMRKAVTAAIGAGDMPLALRLLRRNPSAPLTLDAKLLLIAEDLRERRTERAVQLIQSPAADEASVAFLIPLLTAWNAADRNDLNTALTTLEQVPANSLLGAFRDENRAFILLKFRRAADAEPFARRAIGSAGGREARLRLALADAFLAAGDRQRAAAMVAGMGTEAGTARQRLLAGKSSGQAVDSASKAFAELLLGIAVDLNRMNTRSLPVGLVQVARYADPKNSAAAVLLALLLDGQGRTQEALAAVGSVRADDPLAAQARDTAARILTDNGRNQDALRLAWSATSKRGAGVSDFARLGDVFSAMDRYAEAADAYGRAITLARSQGLTTEQWPLLLLRATALESANRWPEAQQSLKEALAIAPEQPLILNFLGYAKLERGEDLDAAEAMIRKASALAPDDASITDSLGWALYKRGRLGEAIETLQRAAIKDPQQPEIHEHLGDALYANGRRYEARFAWTAALISAEADIATRIRLKLDNGLTSATAAP